MTFYNIIFGFLFIEACKQFLFAFNIHADDQLIAGVIAMMVFNDAVHTSDYFEDHDGEKRPRYTFMLKILDLVNFCFLGLALVSMNICHDICVAQERYLPYEEVRFPSMHSAWVPWALLSAYWLVACLWNWYDGLFKGDWPKWLKRYSLLIGVPFVLNLVLVAWAGSNAGVRTWVQASAVIVPLPYFLWLKDKFKGKYRAYTA